MNYLVNLCAFCLPLILFSYWSMVGYAVLNLLRPQRNSLQNLLLSPVVGFSIILLLCFSLNRMGFPVSDFATILSAILLISSAFILFKNKPIFPFRFYVPFLIIIFLALWLTGRPLVYFGFNWVSYANDDMANYCLGALRFLQHGYFDVPKVDDVSLYRNYSTYYWFLYIFNMTRSGAELLLAWLSGLLHLTPIQIFMPLIITLHLTLISAGCALIYKNRSMHTVAIITGFLLACSPLTTLGTLYQLIAQVMGITLLLTSVILLLQPFTLNQKHNVLKQSILISIIVGAMLIAYPEVMPFVCLSLMIYLVFSLFQGWRPPFNIWLIILSSVLLLLLILNSYWINIIIFLKNQSDTGLSAIKAELFPYFLLPTGLPNLLGLSTLAVPFKEPWQSLAIVISLILLVSLVTIVIKKTFKNPLQPIFIMLLLMVSISLILFIKNSGFGLFKLAMYVQPFLIATIVLIIFHSPNKLYKFCLVLFGLTMVFTQWQYVKFSYGNMGTPYNELSNASKTHMLQELNLLSKSISNDQNLLVDVHTIVPAKLLALYLVDKPVHFYSNNFFEKIINAKKLDYSYRYFNKFNPAMTNTAEDIMATFSKNTIELNFPIKYSNLTNSFYKEIRQNSDNNIVIMATPSRTILNHREFHNVTSNNFISLPQDQVSNHLIFVKSKLGQDYYLGESKHISMRNFENDYFYKHKGVVGLGQYFLFQVINPSNKIRLELNITKTNSQDRKNLLPKPYIIGETYKVFPIVGRGSARVFSPAIRPKTIEGSSYVMLDMGEKGKTFKGERTGLMKLYGTDIILDDRLITAYARDISVVSENEYAHLSPPSFINNFPNDLANPDLEYSGIYEDGWVGEDSFFQLKKPKTHNQLLVQGMLPKIDDNFSGSTLTVLLDGKKLVRQKLKPGEFKINVPAVTLAKVHKVELHFSDIQTLPHGDNRPVSALIKFIGFE